MRGEHSTGAKLQLRPELVVRQLAVALEGDAVDDWILDHLDNDVVAVAPNIHVLEQAGCEQRLKAAGYAVGVEGVAGLHQHIGAYGSSLDALVTLDLDVGDGTPWHRRRLGGPDGCRAAST